MPKCQTYLARVRRLARGKRTKAKQRATGKALGAYRACKSGSSRKTKSKKTRTRRRRSRSRGSSDWFDI